MTLHKKSLRLAGFYLAILMMISLLFSVSVYQLSTQELDKGLRRPGPGSVLYLRGNDMQDLRALLEREHAEQFERARDNVRNRLLTINLIILLAGGVVSYLLAERTLKPIEDALEAQSRFTSDASHELRTPLTIMQSEIEVALLDPGLDLQTAKQLLSSNLDETQKLSRLTDRLLLLARNDQENTVELERLLVQPVLNELIDSFQHVAKGKHITLTSSVKKKCAVLAEHDTLYEILSIVLDNAIKYSPEKSNVSITAQTSSKNIAIMITDEGPGVPADQQEKIFERFYRIDASRDARIPGNGLGLAIARNLTEQLQGKLTVKNNAEKGATFTLELQPPPSKG